MEPTVSSETSATRTQTPGNYPKRNKIHLEHGESLKTRRLHCFYLQSVTSRLSLAHKSQHRLPSLTEHNGSKLNGQLFSNEGCFKMYDQSVNPKHRLLLSRACILFLLFKKKLTALSEVRQFTREDGQWSEVTFTEIRHSFCFLMHPASHVMWISSNHQSVGADDHNKTCFLRDLRPPQQACFH